MQPCALVPMIPFFDDSKLEEDKLKKKIKCLKNLINPIKTQLFILSLKFALQWTTFVHFSCSCYKFACILYIITPLSNLQVNS